MGWGGVHSLPHRSHKPPGLGETQIEMGKTNSMIPTVHFKPESPLQRELLSSQLQSPAQRPPVLPTLTILTMAGGEQMQGWERIPPEIQPWSP